jgi:hypothetical protein
VAVIYPARSEAPGADNGLGNDGHNPLASPRDAATDALMVELRAAIGQMEHIEERRSGAGAAWSAISPSTRRRVNGPGRNCGRLRSSAEAAGCYGCVVISLQTRGQPVERTQRCWSAVDCIRPSSFFRSNSARRSAFHASTARSHSAHGIRARPPYRSIHSSKFGCGGCGVTRAAAHSFCGLIGCSSFIRSASRFLPAMTRSRLER